MTRKISPEALAYGEALVKRLNTTKTGHVHQWGPELRASSPLAEQYGYVKMVSNCACGARLTKFVVRSEP